MPDYTRTPGQIHSKQQ